MKFYGTVKDGEISVHGSVSDYLKTIEGDFELKITLTRDIRTLQMNNMYWWWMGLLSEHSGYTKRELHNYFKTKLLCVEDEMNGEKVINCQSTSDLTVKEFSHYLQEVGRITAENFNFYLPDQLP